MKKILFVCAENRKRSQIAEALFNYLAKDINWMAESAGTMPAEDPQKLDDFRKVRDILHLKIEELIKEIESQEL